MTPGGSARAKGFTLLELVMVLAVMAVLSGAMALSFRGVERRTLQNASRMLQADLRLAQRLAMIEGRAFGILFDGQYQTYQVYSTKPLQEIKKTALPDGVTFESMTAPRLEYLPRGTVSQGFRITLAKGRYRQQLTGTVSGGRIAIKDIYMADT